MMTDETPPKLPVRSARDIDFTEHDYVSPACVHRSHDACNDGCPMCNSMCLCVCHRLRIPMHGYP